MVLRLVLGLTCGAVSLTGCQAGSVSPAGDGTRPGSPVADGSVEAGSSGGSGPGTGGRVGGSGGLNGSGGNGSGGTSSGGNGSGGKGSGGSVMTGGAAGRSSGGAGATATGSAGSGGLGGGHASGGGPGALGGRSGTAGNGPGSGSGGGGASGGGTQGQGGTQGSDPAVGPPFVAVGEQAGRAFSMDGKTWVKAADPVTLPNGWVGPPVPGDNQWLLRGGCQGAGRFLAVGGTAGDQGLMMISSNGRDWTLVGGAQANGDCAFGNGRWMTNVRTSADGTTWQPIANPAEARQVLFGGGLFVAVTDQGGGTFDYSSDGQTWTQLPITYVGTDTNRLGYNAVIYGDGRFLAVNTARADAPILEWDGVSRQSFTETPRTQILGANIAITAVAYGGGQAVIATSGFLFRRAAGTTTWQKTAYTGTSDFFVLVVTNDLFVTSDAWSTDGISWSKATNSLPAVTKIIPTTLN